MTNRALDAIAWTAALIVVAAVSSAGTCWYLENVYLPRQP